MPYNVNPNPLEGLGVFGKVPGTIDLPSPATDLAAQIPGLSKTNKEAIDTINAKLGGSISPATIKALQDAAATYGATSGMFGLPKGGLAMNNLFGNIAGFAEKQAEEGLKDYSSFIPTVSKTQTVDPALQAKIASENALSKAAPSPSAAGSHAEQLFNKYLNALRGGPGGGTRTGGGGGGGGGGARDLLGFPIPGGGSTAEPGIFVGQSRSGGWGLGDAATPIGSDVGPGVPWSPGASAASTDWTDLGFGGGGTPPAGTFTTDTSSSYNPFADYGPFGTLTGGAAGPGSGDTGITDEEWAAITGG